MKQPKTNPFDEILRQRLEGITPEGNPAEHWAAFEELLDEGALEGEVEASTPQADHKELDAQIFNKMHGFTAPFKPSHWKRMEALLNRVFAWPASILRLKSMEMALFLLLFLALWQYFPRPYPAGPEVRSFHIPMAPKEAISRSGAEAEQEDVARYSSANAAASVYTPGLELEAAATAPASPALGKVAKDKARGRSKLVLPVLPSVNRQSVESSAVPSHLPANGSEHSAASAQDSESMLPPLGPIASNPLKAVEYGQFPWAGQEITPYAPRRLRIRLGMFSSGEYNHILVPASEEKRLSQSFERSALGYGGGLTLGFDFGRIELETGAIYAARQYPVGLVYVHGSLADGLEGDELRTTELNIINMPLHLRYDFIQSGKWRAYVLGGGAVQVAFQTNYYTADAPAQFNFMPAVPPPPQAGGSSNEKAIDRIRQNGVGWFEGGSFEDNAYLTANFGFGAERFLTERWSLFAQPVYQYSFHYFKNIDGLGLNNDRINSLSVFFGTRVRLR
jgi:hypothetical protein